MQEKKTSGFLEKIRAREAPAELGGVPTPPGVDFTALWEEPGDASNLQMILTIVNTVLIVITMLFAIFK